jgi:hypothetical protein
MGWAKQRPVSSDQADKASARFCCIPGSVGVAAQPGIGSVQRAVANDGFFILPGCHASPTRLMQI